MSRRVGIIGSRAWPHSHRETRMHIVALLGRADGYGWEVVTGDCPTGIDAMVRELCAGHFMEPIVHHADWLTHGKAAGPIRNAALVADCDEVIAFWHPDAHRGTDDVIRKAKAAGKPVRVIRWGAAGEEQE